MDYFDLRKSNVHIPLDYYRILGVSPDTIDEQLHQAYQDRTTQLPHCEYSEDVIQKRISLLNEAYQVLSDPITRTDYESNFLKLVFSSTNKSFVLDHKQSDIVTQEQNSIKSSSIDIHEDYFSGTLLILYELSEYELVIQYGENYLQSFPKNVEDSSLKSIKMDVTLSISLAYLEITRQLWHDKTYEKAAAAGLKGLAFLEKNRFFLSIQKEICSELNKLRPYRILELLAYPIHYQTLRQKGINLLKSMLEDRHKINEQTKSLSNLKTNDFLSFLQQIRIHLTIDEQKQIFVDTYKNSSSLVASYLKVYILIALGFFRKKPFLILEAQTILENLESHQKVAIEQTVVALLLGQTQLAEKILLNKVKNEPILNFIRVNSQDSPDLLPGLCLYSEIWLKTEVYNSFRDLKELPISLQEYFLDKQVQTYLDGFVKLDRKDDLTPAIDTFKKSSQYYNYRQNLQKFQPTSLTSFPNSLSTENPTIPLSSKTKKTYKVQNNLSVSNVKNYVRNFTKKVIRVQFNKGVLSTTQLLKILLKNNYVESCYFILKSRKNILIILGGVSLTSTCLVLAYKINSPLFALERNQYKVSLIQPLINIPLANKQIVKTTGVLTPRGFHQLIKVWLSSKSKAFGENHDIDSLNKILVDPLLSKWRNHAQKLKQSQSYWVYSHNITVNSLKSNQNNLDQVTGEADIKETGQYYHQGTMSYSYDDILRVQYTLLRRNNRWLIQEIDVIN